MAKPRNGVRRPWAKIATCAVCFLDKPYENGTAMPFPTDTVAGMVIFPAINPDMSIPAHAGSDQPEWFYYRRAFRLMPQWPWRQM